VRDTAVVLGCRIDRLTMQETVARCREALLEGRYLQHMAVNAAKVVAMGDDAEIRDIVEGCELVTADGQAVVWASRLLGDPLPERVAGIDLMHRLIAVAADEGHRVYLLGARKDVLERAVARFRAQHPRLTVAGYRDGYFSEDEWPDVAAHVRASGADMLFVAISSPTKERFLGRYGRQLGVPFVMGVGGAVDVVAGVTRRAPVSWQRLGLEWLYRLLQEPRRMFKRYAATNTRFVGMVAAAWWDRRRRARSDRWTTLP
jgi:N-acetylglucosaminyldiphosphoundecaprenol N-acetyl-beta-D-mannosaminyltransferase